MNASYYWMPKANVPSDAALADMVEWFWEVDEKEPHGPFKFLPDAKRDRKRFLDRQRSR